MDTIIVEANIKIVVNTKHKIENMIKRKSTTKTIIKNTIRVTSMIKREIITINRQEIRVGQEIQVRQEHVIATIGKREVVIRRVFNLS